MPVCSFAKMYQCDCNTGTRPCSTRLKEQLNRAKLNREEIADKKMSHKEANNGKWKMYSLHMMTTRREYRCKITAVTPQVTPTIFTSHVTTSTIFSQDYDYGSSNSRHSVKSLTAHVASTTIFSSALVSPFITPSRPIRAIYITPNATPSTFVSQLQVFPSTTSSQINIPPPSPTITPAKITDKR
eukprot:Awhi_evm1s984